MQYQMMHRVCARGDVGAVAAFLDTGFGQRDALEAAFRAACRKGHVQVVRLLLERKSNAEMDVHAHRNGAFRGACAGGHVGVVLALLELDRERLIDVHAHADAPLRAAARRGHSAVLRVLIALRRPKCARALLLACSHGHGEALDVILKHSDDEWLPMQEGFVLACAHGHIDVVRKLRKVSHFEVGAGSKTTGFGYACANGHSAVVHELLGDAAVSAMDVTKGFTYACTENRPKIARQLLAIRGPRAVRLQGQ